MGDQHPPNRTPCQRPHQQLFPDRTAAFAVEPGIDNRPAILIGQRIDIDVIQHHRQWHAKP